MIPHNRSDGLGCFPAVIKRNTGGVVVCNVGLSLPLRFCLYLENVMEDVFTDETEIAIHREPRPRVESSKLPRDNEVVQGRCVGDTLS
jgi:hypothetical protein